MKGRTLVAMCASYGLQTTPGKAAFPVFSEKVQADLSAWMDANQGETVKPTGIRARNYNPVIRERDGQMQVEDAWWTLWPGGKRTQGYFINATVEALMRSWKVAFTRWRVLVPVTEYFEWSGEKGSKTRYSFHLPDREGFVIAGVAQPITTDEVESMLSYAIVTRPPTEKASEIHNRMPLVLPPSFHEEWTNPEPAVRSSGVPRWPRRMISRSGWSTRRVRRSPSRPARARPHRGLLRSGTCGVRSRGGVGLRWTTPTPSRRDLRG